jgi:hypothetical protein
MAYAKETSNYGIPYISNNEILDGTESEIAAEIIDNQLRAGILGGGGTRVFQNGIWTATIVDLFTGMVELTLDPSGSGLPSVQGVANNGLVEVYDSITWTNLATNSKYFIYVQALESTYTDPTSVNIIASTTPITRNDHLFLATITTVNTDGSATPPTNPSPSQPIVDDSPDGKPTLPNLFELLNATSDPFGVALTQTVLTVLSQFSVLSDYNQTALFQQLSPDATLPVITIDNRSINPRQPDIFASYAPLLLADINVPDGFALSEDGATAYIGLAKSIIGALNENWNDIQNHIHEDTNPHGSHLFQTSLSVSGLLDVVQLKINAKPPGPPSPPPPPGQLSYLDIYSTGELRIGDSRGGMYWSDSANPYYQGASTSLMGALNDLLNSIAFLAEEVGGVTGTVQAGLTPIIFEIAPEDLGLPLHFKLTVGKTEDFSNIIVTKESKISQAGWFYEYQPSALPPSGPPSPPPPPINPYSLPGTIQVPDPAPLPYWVPVPSGGVPGNAQTLLSGEPVRVKYEPQTGDNLFCRIMYSIAVQEFNGEYGEADLSSIVFD